MAVYDGGRSVRRASIHNQDLVAMARVVLAKQVFEDDSQVGLLIAHGNDDRNEGKLPGVAKGGDSFPLILFLTPTGNTEPFPPFDWAQGLWRTRQPWNKLFVQGVERRALAIRGEGFADALLAGAPLLLGACGVAQEDRNRIGNRGRI